MKQETKLTDDRLLKGAKKWWKSVKISSVNQPGYSKEGYAEKYFPDLDYPYLTNDNIAHIFLEENPEFKSTNTIQEQKGLQTKGEWKVIDGVGDIAIVCDRNGERVHTIAKIYQGTLTRYEKLANAQLIVKSVNEYPKLVDTIKELQKDLEFLLKNFDSEKYSADAIVRANTSLTK